MPAASAAQYFDLQVNGYAGVDFNADDLTAEGLHEACRRQQADGVKQFLPTIITAALPAMERRLRRLVELRATHALAAAMTPGVHVEGPFISAEPGYVGAHPAAATLARVAIPILSARDRTLRSELAALARSRYAYPAAAQRLLDAYRSA